MPWRLPSCWDRAATISTQKRVWSPASRNSRAIESSQLNRGDAHPRRAGVDEDVIALLDLCKYYQSLECCEKMSALVSVAVCGGIWVSPSRDARRQHHIARDEQSRTCEQNFR